MIPEAAVEAALEAFHANCDVDFDGLHAVKAALEAAATHMVAAALETVADELDGADRVTRERDGYTATISLPNAAIYLRRHAATYRTTK